LRAKHNTRPSNAGKRALTNKLIALDYIRGSIRAIPDSPAGMSGEQQFALEKRVM
jgi:hypothetical protein